MCKLRYFYIFWSAQKARDYSKNKYIFFSKRANKGCLKKMLTYFVNALCQQLIRTYLLIEKKTCTNITMRRQKIVEINSMNELSQPWCVSRLTIVPTTYVIVYLIHIEDVCGIRTEGGNS